MLAMKRVELSENKGEPMLKPQIRMVFITLICVIILSNWVGVDHAADDLFLTGYVKSVDGANSTVTIDVRSESCKGIRTFRMPDKAKDDLNASLVGVKLNFSIDGATCERGKLYTIVIEE